jgi:hypothetical protein
MTISLKVCALCKGPLAVRHPAPRADDRTVRYICGNHVPGHKLSHYYVEVKGPIYIQIVHVPPYVLLNYSDKETSEIYPFNLEEGRISDRDKVISLPKIPVTTVEKMTDRIKLLILFS